jgi:hypothetical protein
MRRGEKSAPTDVCLVIPGKSSSEHWPFQLDRLDLSDMRLVAWKSGDEVSCG